MASRVPVWFYARLDFLLRYRSWTYGQPRHGYVPIDKDRPLHNGVAWQKRASAVVAYKEALYEWASAVARRSDNVPLERWLTFCGDTPHLSVLRKNIVIVDRAAAVKEEDIHGKGNEQFNCQRSLSRVLSNEKLIQSRTLRIIRKNYLHRYWLTKFVYKFGDLQSQRLCWKKKL